MAKKNKKQQSSSSPDASSDASSSPSLAASSSVPVAVVVASAPLTGEAGELERAWVLGNFAKVRHLAATATTDSGRAVAARLLNIVKIEREQMMVGLGALVFITIAAVLALT